MDIFPFRAHWQDTNTLIFTADGGIRRWQRGEDITAVPFEIILQFELSILPSNAFQDDFWSKVPDCSDGVTALARKWWTDHTFLSTRVGVVTPTTVPQCSKKQRLAYNLLDTIDD